MNRIVIFASFDKSGVVHNYVLSYLQKLKDHSNKIIFIADNFSNKEEIKKLNHLVDYHQFKPHGEYDFGSYKRGYLYAQEQGWLKNADEIIFCNDSCFTVGSFNKVFAEMNLKICDFWGITASSEIQSHLQSFFLVFKKQVFNSEVFKTWINHISKKNNVTEIIKAYEVPLTSILEQEGFRWSSFIYSKINPTIYPITLLKKNIPLVKKKCFFNIESTFQSPKNTLSLIKKLSTRDFNNIFLYFNVKYEFQIYQNYYKIKIIRFFYQKKKTKSGRLLVKICKIPVFF